MALSFAGIYLYLFVIRAFDLGHLVSFFSRLIPVDVFCVHYAIGKESMTLLVLPLAERSRPDSLVPV